MIIIDEQELFNLMMEVYMNSSKLSNPHVAGEFVSKLMKPLERSVSEDLLRNFIRANHLTAKWDEYLEQISKPISDKIVLCFNCGQEPKFDVVTGLCKKCYSYKIEYD